MACRSIICARFAVGLIAGIPLILRGADPTTAGAVIQQYCIGCHNAKLKTAGLVLNITDLEQIEEHSAVWEKVVRKLRTGEMPPAGMPRPDKATYTNVAAELETAL